MRDYELLMSLSFLPDHVWIGTHEVAAMTGLAPITIQQRRVAGMPRPVPGVRRLRWRMGEIRTWLSHAPDGVAPATRH